MTDDDESIEPAPVPNSPAQAAAASKVSVVYKAPLGSGRPKGGVVGKVASSPFVEKESDSDEEGERDAKCNINDSNKATVQDDVSSWVFETLILRLSFETCLCISSHRTLSNI